MLYFDVAMPAALFVIIMVAMFLEKRVEGKLKSTFEEREFRARDAIALVVMIGGIISVIAYISQNYPGNTFQATIVAVFLFSYSMLLFTFSSIFSNMEKRKAQLFCAGFGIASIIAGTVGLLNPFVDSLTLYRVVAFYGLATFAFFALLYEQKRAIVKERLHLAVLPPALFLLLYLLYNTFYNGTPVWYPYLLDVYGFTFAVLIILYLGTLFSWKSTFIFAGLLTIMDIILVLGTQTMQQTVKIFTNVGLPVLVSLPIIPPIVTSEGLLPMGLGLGDFFFAGILAIQTFKKFDQKTAVLSALTMSAAFAIFEVFLLNTSFFDAFPGTLMIICGWLPVVAWKLFAERKVSNNRVGS